jgi:hypothetical protein
VGRDRKSVASDGLSAPLLCCDSDSSTASGQFGASREKGLIDAIRDSLSELGWNRVPYLPVLGNTRTTEPP